MYLLMREKEIERLVVPLIYTFIGCFLYVPCLEVKPETLVYREDTLSNQLSYLARVPMDLE